MIEYGCQTPNKAYSGFYLFYFRSPHLLPNPSLQDVFHTILVSFRLSHRQHCPPRLRRQRHGHLHFPENAEGSFSPCPVFLRSSFSIVDVDECLSKPGDRLQSAHDYLGQERDSPPFMSKPFHL